MLFRIKGVDARGQKRELSMDAASEQEALQRAAEMAVQVTVAGENKAHLIILEHAPNN